MQQNDNSFSPPFYIYPLSSQLLHFSLSGTESDVQSIPDIVTAIQGMSEGTFVNRFIK
jgi:protein involved in ribonucleotide reduction